MKSFKTSLSLVAVSLILLRNELLSSAVSKNSKSQQEFQNLSQKRSRMLSRAQWGVLIFCPTHRSETWWLKICLKRFNKSCCLREITNDEAEKLKSLFESSISAWAVPQQILDGKIGNFELKSSNRWLKNVLRLLFRSFFLFEKLFYVERKFFLNRKLLIHFDEINRWMDFKPFFCPKIIQNFSRF